MKKSLLIIQALLVIVLWGCEENPVEEYGDNLIHSYERSRDAADKANVAVYTRAVSAYRAAFGKNPDSLEDLGNFIGEEIDPDKFGYDPATGTVSLR